MFPNQNEVPKKQTRRDKLIELENTSDVMVYGASSVELKNREKDLDKLINKTLKATIENQFGNTNKPLEYFSLNMINALWRQTDRGKGKSKKDFEEVLKEYVQENQLDNSAARRVKYDNYRNIYSHIPAAHVALNIYKASILSPEDLTDEPINFKYDSNDDGLKKILEKRIKDRVIDKYKLNEQFNQIVKEALIDGVSYRAVISIEKDISDIMANKKILTENAIRDLDNDYNNYEVKFYDSEISKETTKAFNEAIQSSISGYIKVGEQFLSKNSTYEDKTLVESYLGNLKNFIETDAGKNKKPEKVEYTGVQIGRFVRDLINENIKIKSKYDFMEDYTSALQEGGYHIDTPILTEAYGDEQTRKKDQYYLNGSKIIKLEPEKVTPLRIGGITIGYIYAEQDLQAASPMTVNAGDGGTSNISMGAPVSFGVNTYGTSGMGGGAGNMGGYGNNVVNPLSTFGVQQTNNNLIVDLFVNGLGKKLNKNFIRNNKDLKELIHELLREKYITQKKVAVTFFSSDDIIETRVKPLFEGSEYFAKLYLAELTNNITISLGRGMDRRMIKVPFGMDDDMYQTVQDAIRAFKTREFSMASIDESTISNLVRNSPGRYEDMYVPVGPDGRDGYGVDILPGMDNSKSSELLPMLRNQFLDSINIPANAIDSLAEADFSRSIALRNIYFSKEIVDYQKYFNESVTQMIRKLYGDEYRYNGDKENNEPNVNIDLFVASFSKPKGLSVSTTLETMQNVDLFATMAVNTIADMTDPSNAAAAHKLKKKIFVDTMPYLPWDEWEKYYEESKKEAIIQKVKKSGKKGDPTVDDPNDFNPSGGFNY